MAFAYDPMSDLARRKAQLKATGQPDMSIAELQAYGGGVMEAKSRAELSAQAQADRRNEVALNQSNIQEQAKVQKISGATSLGLGLIQLEVASRVPPSYNPVTGAITPGQKGIFSSMYGAGKESIMGAPSEAAIGGTSAGGAGGTFATSEAGAMGSGEAFGVGPGLAEGGGTASLGASSALGTFGAGYAVGGPAYKYGPGGNKLPGTFGSEKDRRTQSGVIKGGTAGAAIGAAVGVWFFGIGAVPGAIIGGIGGAIAGGLSGSKDTEK
jgi:hypothetical protein